MGASVKKVLFVDDEINIRQSFADYFEDNLWETLQAETGEQALEILKTEAPQGAVVDIRMGGMDGNTFIRTAYHANPHLNFIICTGSPEYDVPPDLKKWARVSDTLFRKPVTDMAELEKTLSLLIQANQSNKE